MPFILTQRVLELQMLLPLLKKEIAERDYKDSHREVSPLKPADDAIHFDTTGVGIDQVVAFIEEKAKKILDNPS